MNNLIKTIGSLFVFLLILSSSLSAQLQIVPDPDPNEHTHTYASAPGQEYYYEMGFRTGCYIANHTGTPSQEQAWYNDNLQWSSNMETLHSWFVGWSYRAGLMEGIQACTNNFPNNYMCIEIGGEIVCVAYDEPLVEYLCPDVIPGL